MPRHSSLIRMGFPVVGWLLVVSTPFHLNGTTGVTERAKASRSLVGLPSYSHTRCKVELGYVDVSESRLL